MRVIAMAYMDQPLDRFLTGRVGNLAYIAAPSLINANGYPQNYGVGFPIEAVFEFDQALFDSLRMAWESGDESTLQSAWKAAVPLYRTPEVQ